jgi:hypothetical protein
VPRQACKDHALHLNSSARNIRALPKSASSELGIRVTGTILRAADAISACDFSHRTDGVNSAFAVCACISRSLGGAQGEKLLRVSDDN